MTNIITVDSAEPAPYRESVRAAFGIPPLNLPVHYSRLRYGDYRWTVTINKEYREVLIERKTVPDLLSSIRDGRWAKQLTGLSQTHYPWVLIEGEYHATTTDQLVIRNEVVDGWRYSDLDSLLTRAELSGVGIARCGRGADLVAARLVSLYNQIGRNDSRSLAPKKERIRTEDPHEYRARAMLMQLPGIGKTRAKTLLAKHGTVMAVLVAMLEGKAPMNREQEATLKWTKV